MSGMNRAIFAGRWYSDDPRRLAADLEGYRTQAAEISSRDLSSRITPERNTPDRIAADRVPRDHALVHGAVLPHAGLAYSGRGIAHAFTGGVLDLDSIRRVLILSPSHYVPLRPTTLLVETFDTHETPFGSLVGEPSFALRLAKEIGDEARIANEVIEMEHGTEMFLPFLKRYTPDAAVSLVLVPEISGEDRLDRWSDAIRSSVADEDTLLVMSSDFTHYGPRFDYTPFGTPDRRKNADTIAADVAEDDRRVAEWIATHDTAALRARMARPITVCGRFPIVLGLEVLYRGVTRRRPGRVVDYYTSREIGGGDDSNFVCYGSILFPDQPERSRKA
ncbi:MAG: AmmeMemoRadiSam system protein B [Alkalispirochaeta sp.]